MTDLFSNDLPVPRANATLEAAPRTPTIEQQPIVISVKADISDAADAGAAEDFDQQRVRDDEQRVVDWDSDRGEPFKHPAKPASGKVQVEVAVRVALEALCKRS